MILESYGVVDFFIPLATSFPVFLLIDIWSSDENTLQIISAIINRFLNYLLVNKRNTDYLTRSVKPCSWG